MLARLVMAFSGIAMVVSCSVVPANVTPVWCWSSPRAISGTPGDDDIEGTSGDDVICGGPGDDRIHGGGGNDLIFGGPGDDVISAEVGRDTIVGGDGADHVKAGGGADTIYGDAGATYSEEPGADTATGDDVIDGDTGSDSIQGGPGNDVIQTGGDGEDAYGVTMTYGGPGDDLIVSDLSYRTYAEYFFGEAGNDVLWPHPLRSSPLGNAVWGGPGSDLIVAVNALPDGGGLDDMPDSVQAPVTARCTVAASFPLGAVQCDLPGSSSSRLTASIGTDGRTELSGPLFTGLSQLSAAGQNGALDVQFDTCLCDPDVRGWPFSDQFVD